MPLVSNSFDLKLVEWRRITEPSSKAFRVDFEYSLLGYDLATQRLDMLLRYGEGGHCRRHRHVAATATLVLEGEQFLEELQPDGSIKSIHRTKGSYALANADAHPHDEHGGDHGGTVLLSMTAASDGVLFEYFDENMQNPWTVSIREYVESWEKGTAYGAGPSMAGADLEHADGVAHDIDSSDPANLDTMADEKRLKPPEEQPTLHESQEVSAEGRVYDLSSSPLPNHGLGPVSRFHDIQKKENMRSWRIGLALSAVIGAMLCVAVYFIVGAYDRTLPPSDKNLGDLTRPSLR